jgi:hypothetical protein
VISSNEDLLPGIEAINANNLDLFKSLEALRKQDEFRYYSVDILASCEYMPQELFECYTQSCEIYPVDEDEVPETIREIDMDEAGFELDGWGRWDMPSSDYYDTEMFPEGYTNYDGSEVWNFIHNRICFQEFDFDDDHWKADYNKAVSGLHSMISAQVIQGIQEKLDDGEEFEEDEIWRDPKAEFARRLSPEGETPLALENLYFCFMLMLTAVSKARDRLYNDMKSGKVSMDTSNDLRHILESPLLVEPTVDIAFTRLKARAIKDSDSSDALWEARMRTRELLRIMNCVQCNKCRLHGKISVMGLSTALQILLGRTGKGGDPTHIHRVELAALMATLHKCSRALKFCQKMHAS